MINNNPYDWAFFIDIEGFSNKYYFDPCKARADVLNLIEVIYNSLNTISLIEPSVKLYTYQFGSDGFLIGQRGPNRSDNLKIPVALAISILRVMAIHDCCCRVQMSFGTMVTYTGCFPQKIKSNMVNGCVIKDKHLMVLYPSIGDAIINAHKLKAPKGPLFVVAPYFKSTFDIQKIEYKSLNYFENKKSIEYLEINWVQYSSPEVELILEKLIGGKINQDVIYKLENYIKTNKLPKKWIASANILLKTQ